MRNDELLNLKVIYRPYNIADNAVLRDFEIEVSGHLSFVYENDSTHKVKLMRVPYAEMSFIVLSELMNCNSTYIGRLLSICDGW